MKYVLNIDEIQTAVAEYIIRENKLGYGKVYYEVRCLFSSKNKRDITVTVELNIKDPQ